MWLNLHSSTECSVATADHNKVDVDGENVCTCGTYSFDQYCSKFDAIQMSEASETDDSATFNNAREQQLYLETRKMMYIMLSCNRLYGHDGFTYDSDGKATGEEFIAINRRVEKGVINCVFFSDIDKFRM